MDLGFSVLEIGANDGMGFLGLFDYWVAKFQSFKKGVLFFENLILRFRLEKSHFQYDNQFLIYKLIVWLFVLFPG